MMPDFCQFCVCAICRGELRSYQSSLQCITCGIRYEVRDGIPIFLPHYSESERNRYFLCYEDIARDDLAIPLEGKREARHSVLVDFVGDVRGKKVLDIGSSNGIYLRQLNAGFKVAFDLAYLYLSAIPKTEDIVPICGDAEYLPFKPGFFDVIIISDILEHLLKPERLISLLRMICTKTTRLIVHIPWREDIAHYKESKYEFAHLRSFGPYTFSQLWTDEFRVTRARPTYPSLEEPIVFQLESYLPTFIYSFLVKFYYASAYFGQYEYEKRAVWIREIPKRERWLLYFYPPKFKIFELHRDVRSPRAYLIDRLLFKTGLLRLESSVHQEPPP